MSARDDVELLLPAQVGEMLRVDPKMVSRYGRQGLLLRWRTPSGRSRYFGAEVRALLRGESRPAAREFALAERALLTEQAAPR